MLLLIFVLFSVFSALFGAQIGSHKIKKYINLSALSDNDGENRVSFVCRNRIGVKYSLAARAVLQ